MANIWQNYYRSHKLWRDGHTYGMCKVNHDQRLFYVLIPKNASTSIRNQISKYKFEDGNYHDLNLVKQRYTPIIFIREPLDRWSSGMAEFITRRLGGKWKQFLNSPEFVKLMFARVAFDEHTESQAMYVQGIGIDKAVVLRVDDDLNKNLSNFLRSKGIENTIDEENKKYTSVGGKLDCKERLLEMLEENEDYKKKIQGFYSVDYDLINRVKYYNK